MESRLVSALPALIFDLDGTLIDSAPDIHQGVLATLRSEALDDDLTFDQTRSFIGKGVPALIQQVRAAKNLPEDADQSARMAAYFTALYETAVEYTVLYPHVKETLIELHATGHALAICTNKPEKPTMTVLEHFGITYLFTGFAFGDGPYPRKPDPAPVHHVIAQLGAAQALYIGDSETDAKTAQNAGVPMLLFTEGYRKTPVEQIPHAAMFSHFSDLPKHIAAL